MAGFAPGSARVTACRLLTKDNVAKEIEARRRQRDAEQDRQILALVRQYASIAFSRVCPLDYLLIQPDRRPTLRPVATWTAEMRLMCKEVRESRTGVRVVLRNRDHAQRMLTRYTGGFTN